MENKLKIANLQNQTVTDTTTALKLDWELCYLGDLSLALLFSIIYEAFLHLNTGLIMLIYIDY